jgi:hypothetical protein
VQAPALRLTDLLTPQLPLIRFETALREYAISSELASEPKLRTTFGSVRGRVQTFGNRQALRFTIVDALFNKPVACYLSEDQRGWLEPIDGKKVSVSGRVTREAGSIQPLSVRDIRHIEEIPYVPPVSYLQARGILEGISDDEPAEVTIRRMRDAEG